MFSYFTDMFASTVAFLSLFLSVACFYQLMVLHVADLTCSLPDHVIVCNENDGGFGSVLWPPLNHTHLSMQTMIHVILGTT